MSQLDVDKVVPQSGTSLQLGENGDTISVPVNLPTGVDASWQVHLLSTRWFSS